MEITLRVEISAESIFKFIRKCMLPDLKKGTLDTQGDPQEPEFKVIYVKPKGHRISAVKAVRNVLDLSLKEAKDIIDNSPTVLKTTTSEQEALGLKKAIEAEDPDSEVMVKQC